MKMKVSSFQLIKKTALITNVFTKKSFIVIKKSGQASKHFKG